MKCEEKKMLTDGYCVSDQSGKPYVFIHRSCIYTQIKEIKGILQQAKINIGIIKFCLFLLLTYEHCSTVE